MEEGTKLAGTAIVSLLTGGLAGSLFNAYRARRLDVRYTAEVFPVLHPKPEGASLTARVVVEHGAHSETLDNLYLIKLQIRNSGPADRDRFEFGVTLPSGDYDLRAIHVEGEGADRHHEATANAPLDPAAPRHAADIVARPFNRGDAYTVRVYVVVQKGDRDPAPDDIQLGSREAVCFRRVPTYADILAASAEELLAGPPLTVVSRLLARTLAGLVR